MSVKLADTLAPMGAFEVADAKDISVEIDGNKKMLQTAIDNGEIGGGGDSSWTGTQAEFDAYDKSQLKDGQEVIITDDYDAVNGNVYSTEEKVVGTFLGKPLYRKSWVGTGNPADFNHNITSLGDVIKIDGCFLTTSSNWLNFAGSDSSVEMYLCRAVVSPTQIAFTRRNYLITKYTLSVEYTKTTD